MALANHYTHQRKLSLERILTEQSEMHVTVKKLPSYLVAYVRSWGSYSAEARISAFTRLLQWASPRGFVHDKSLL
jgi:hypothetical protein